MFSAPQAHGIAMRLAFNRPAFAALLAVTALEALIATLGKPYPLLRGFVGDVVAVGWAYLVYRSFIRASVLPLAGARRMRSPGPIQNT